MAKNPTEDAVEGARPRRGRKKLVLIVVLALLIAGGVFTGLQLMTGSDAKAAESGPPPEGEVVDVTTLTTVVGGDEHLARVGLAVVLSEGASPDAATAKFPLLEDAAVSELARTDAQVLRTADGADDLRKRLTKRARKIYSDGEVLRVLLTELVVQ